MIKKLLILNILDILKRYSDADHRLSQKEIAQILEREYHMTAERKAIRRNIMDLMDCGYNIEHTESVRMVPGRNGGLEESCIWSDFYLKREFDDSELRLLIDSLLFSRHIPYSQCKELVEKLEGLSSVYFRSRIRHIARMPEDRTDNKQLFLNIELLDEAICRGRKVCFQYAEYGTDKKMHPKRRADGEVRRYVVSPYQMAAREGKYYLVCNYDPYDDISNYRLDRIRELEILEEPRKPFESLGWAKGQRLDLAAYMQAHPYMYAGETVRVTMRVTKPMVTDVIDLFGKEVTFYDEDEDGVTVSVYASEPAAEQFAKSYAPDVIVLKPEKMAERVRHFMEISYKAYTQAEEHNKQD